MKRKTDMDQKGFTLLEALVAMSILTISLLSAIMTTCYVIKSNAMSKNMTFAVNLAQNKIDDLKIADYTSGIAGSTETDIDENGASGGIFDRTVTVVSENITLEYKTVEVKIDWNDYSSRQLVLKTIIAK